MDIPANCKELQSLQKQLKAQGVENIPVCRHVHWEYALPCNEQEFIDLCGFALLRLEANSEVLSELPIKKVYVRQTQGEPIVLPRIRLGDEYDKKITDKSSGPGKEHFTQVSFWLFPAFLLTDEGSVLLADFTEGRDEFSMARGPWRDGYRVLETMNNLLAKKLSLRKGIDAERLSSFLSREFPGRL